MCLSCSKVYIFIISLKTIQNFSVEVTPLTQLASPFLGIHARLYYFLTLTFYVYTISTMLIMCPSSSNSSIPSLTPSYHKYSGLSNLETCSLSPFPCMAIFEEKTWRQHSQFRPSSLLNMNFYQIVRLRNTRFIFNGTDQVQQIFLNSTCLQF